MSLSVKWQGGRPSLKARAQSIRQLAVMLKSGVPLSRALQVLGSHSPSEALGQAWRDVYRATLEGKSLSRAMARHTAVFQSLELGMARSAEVSSRLDSTFSHLADLLEMEAKVSADLKQSVRYPLVLTGFGCAAVAVFTEYVMPTFVSLFESMGEQLPLITRLLMGSSRLFHNGYFLIMLALLLGAVVWGVRRNLATPYGRWQWQHLVMRLPWLGTIWKRVLVMRFCRLLAGMLQSGVPLLPAMESAGSALGNYPLSEAVELAVDELKCGTRISKAFHYSSFFPRLMVNMLAAGEESESVPLMLNHLARLYEEQTTVDFERLTRSFEPLALGVLGVSVGVVLLGMFMPIYRLIGTM